LLRSLLLPVLAIALMLPLGAARADSPSRVRAHVVRHWEALLRDHTDPPRLQSYTVKRCGPRACIVRWQRTAIAGSLHGVDGCYWHRGTRVRCHNRWTALPRID
jgi:hypothetical protein